MSNKTTLNLANVVRDNSYALTGARSDYDPLIQQIGDARYVLLGEASHGTHEFYRERAQITRRLIQEKNFNVVAVEADWPDAYRVNRYVRGASEDAEAIDSLAGFKRFPTWMWRNADVLDFVGWLREHNDALTTDAHKVGFYGLDLYSLHASIDAVLGYLNKVDPKAAERARYRYSCFDHFGEDTQAYGYAAGFNLTESCEHEVVRQLLELRKHATDYASRDGRVAVDDFFFAEQNARLVKNAEEYYRSMFRGTVPSWNLRDRHMAETLESLVRHFAKQGQAAKVVVWAHNSHLGDARATEMGERGELNVGQLVRERHGKNAVLIGFGTSPPSASGFNRRYETVTRHCFTRWKCHDSKSQWAKEVPRLRRYDRHGLSGPSVLFIALKLSVRAITFTRDLPTSLTSCCTLIRREP
jgi:erythromycin esterase-like protein